MENIKFKPNLFRRVVAFILAMTMCLSLGITYTFAASGTFSGYSYTTDDTNQTMTIETDDFKLTINNNATRTNEGALDIKEGTVAFKNNGNLSDTGKIQTEGSSSGVQIGKAYIELIPKKDGAFTLSFTPPDNKNIGVATANDKDDEKTHSTSILFAKIDRAAGTDTEKEVAKTEDGTAIIKLSTPGDVSATDTTQIFKKGEFTLTAAKKDISYWFALGGSKLTVQGVSFVPEGGVTPPPAGEDTTEADTEADTEKDTESATEKDTVATTEKDTEASTEGSTEAPLALGNVDGSADGKITANDASMVLQYVLDKVNHSLSSVQLAAAEVSGDDVITAMDAAQILNKSIDPSYVFTKNNTPSVDTTEKTTEETTVEVKTEDSTTEPDTTEPGPAPSGNPTLWVLGDSTVCNYTSENVESYNFRQGWGMRLEDYVDTSKITIKNLARSGRSARDFYLYEGGAPYKEYTDGLKAGDYVLIQFGHNDEKDLLKAWKPDDEGFASIPENQRVEITQELKDSTNTQAAVGQIATVDGNYGKREGGIGGAAGLNWETEADENGYVEVEKIISVPGTASEGGKVPSFEWYYFNKYIQPAQEVGATVILVTPVTRLQGAPKDTNKDGINEVADIGQHTNCNWKTTGIMGMNYVAAIKKLADDKGLKYIDLTALSQEYWNKIFTDKVASGATEAEAYDYARKLLHAYNKGDGKTTDKTHLSKDGAAAAAKLITDSVREQNLPLAEYLKPVAE